MPQLVFKPSAHLLEVVRQTPEGVAYLQKNVHGYLAEHHDEQVRKAFEKAQDVNQLEWLLTGGAGRNQTHLARLARNDHAVEKGGSFPADVEKRFALDFLTHCKSFRKQPKALVAFEAIGTEGVGVNHFWTFAPYLHHEFTSLGKKPRDSLKILLSWVHDTIKNYESVSPLRSTLKGLEFDLLFSKVYQLERDDVQNRFRRSESGKSEWATHEMAAQLAKEFAPVLLKAYGTGVKK